MKTPKVSICCVTYNQKDYIKEAIESFLSQETDFPIEIIIHDDASTDGTKEIILDYANKYPDIIIPIIQQENQFSKKIRIAETFVYPIARGKYIAICEGDDFWTDIKKIQKQYDFMEIHDECSMCIHDAWIINEDKTKVFPSKALSKEPCYFGTIDAIKGLGKKAVTNSFFFRKSIINEPLPEFLINAPTGDLARTIVNSLYGSIYYMTDKMSAHRVLAKNSWSSNMRNNVDRNTLWINHNDKQIEMFNKIDEYTDYKYTDVINEVIEEYWFKLYLKTNNVNMLKKEPYKNMYKKLSIKEKLKWRFPKVVILMKKPYYKIIEIKSRKIDI